MGRVVFSPDGMRELRRYRAHVQRLVSNRTLTTREADILFEARMTELVESAYNQPPIRRPRCRSCGQNVPIVGTIAHTFRCACSPGLEQSIVDGMRSNTE